MSSITTVELDAIVNGTILHNVRLSPIHRSHGSVSLHYDALMYIIHLYNIDGQNKYIIKQISTM